MRQLQPAAHKLSRHAMASPRQPADTLVTEAVLCEARSNPEHILITSDFLRRFQGTSTSHTWTLDMEICDYGCLEMDLNLES